MCPLLALNVAQMFSTNNYMSDAMRQLELNLTPRTEHHGSIEPWVYRFEAGTLLEELDTRRQVYGRWDKLFGCWKIDTRTNASTEIVPTWVPLNSRGIWRDPLDIRFENAPKASWLLSPKWRYEANAAFAAYFSSIPHRIRSVVAPFGHYQWLALDMIWQVPEFAHFLDEEMFNGSLQYVFACMALGDATKLSRAARRNLANDMMTAKRSNLLSILSAVTSTKKVLRLLKKLGDRPHRASTYLSLFDFIAHEPSCKALLHADALDPNSIRLLNGFPRGFLAPNLVRLIIDHPDECEILCDYDDYEPGSGFRTLVDLYPELSSDWQNRVHKSLRTVKNGNELPEWGEQWAHRLSEVIQFPSPPFRANHNLIPLATAKAVRQEALAMRNCISRMIGRVMAGEIFFYNWDGPEPATVMVEKSSDGSWGFSEAHGYSNHPLDDQTKGYIRSFVETAFRQSVVPSS
jgi:hypothetical protein